MVLADSIWVWGRHPVLEALRSGAVQTILISESVRDAPIISEIQQSADRRRASSVRRVPASEVERRAEGQPSQGIVAEVRLASIQHDRQPAGDCDAEGRWRPCS